MYPNIYTRTYLLYALNMMDNIFSLSAEGYLVFQELNPHSLSIWVPHLLCPVKDRDSAKMEYIYQSC
jgi:hypothetical protein